MLKKENRLAKSKDIAVTLFRGRTFFNPFLTLKFAPLRQGRKFTVVVSTKVSKKAVTRNRLKRLLREHLRKNLNSFGFGNYVVIVKAKAVALPAADLVRAFVEVLAKIKR